MMTRKDYVATAQIINEFRDLIIDEIIFADLVDEFSAMFEVDNERFDANRFAIACYKELEMAN